MRVTGARTMRIYITAFPIDRAFQKKIGIYDSGEVKSISVGKVINKLLKAGYTECNSFVEMTGTLDQQFTMHFTK